MFAYLNTPRTPLVDNEVSIRHFLCSVGFCLQIQCSYRGRGKPRKSRNVRMGHEISRTMIILHKVTWADELLQIGLT